MTQPIAPEILFLKQEDVIKAGVLDMPKTIADVEQVFKMYADWRDQATGEDLDGVP